MGLRKANNGIGGGRSIGGSPIRQNYNAGGGGIDEPRSSQDQYDSDRAAQAIQANQRSAIKRIEEARAAGLDTTGKEYDELRRVAAEGLLENKRGFGSVILGIIDGPRQAINLGIQDVFGGAAEKGFEDPGLGDYVDAFFGGTSNPEELKFRTGLDSISGSGSVTAITAALGVNNGKGWEVPPADGAHTGERIARGLTQFALEVVTDPLTYVGLGLGVFGKKAALAESARLGGESTKKVLMRAPTTNWEKKIVDKLDGITDNLIEDVRFKYGDTELESLNANLKRMHEGEEELLEISGKSTDAEKLAFTERYRDDLSRMAVEDEWHNGVTKPILNKDFGNIDPDANEMLASWLKGGVRLQFPFMKDGFKNGYLIPNTQGLGRKLFGDRIRSGMDMAVNKWALVGNVKRGALDFVDHWDTMAPWLRMVKRGDIKAWQYNILDNYFNKSLNDASKAEWSSIINGLHNELLDEIKVNGADASVVINAVFRQVEEAAQISDNSLFNSMSMVETTKPRTAIKGWELDEHGFTHTSVIEDPNFVPGNIRDNVDTFIARAPIEKKAAAAGVEPERQVFDTLDEAKAWLEEFTDNTIDTRPRPGQSIADTLGSSAARMSDVPEVLRPKVQELTAYIVQTAQTYRKALMQLVPDLGEEFWKDSFPAIMTPQARRVIELLQSAGAGKTMSDLAVMQANRDHGAGVLVEILAGLGKGGRVEASLAGHAREGMPKPGRAMVTVLRDEDNAILISRRAILEMKETANVGLLELASEGTVAANMSTTELNDILWGPIQALATKYGVDVSHLKGELFSTDAFQVANRYLDSLHQAVESFGLMKTMQDAGLALPSKRIVNVQDLIEVTKKNAERLAPKLKREVAKKTDKLWKQGKRIKAAQKQAEAAGIDAENVEELKRLYDLAHGPLTDVEANANIASAGASGATLHQGTLPNMTPPVYAEPAEFLNSLPDRAGAEEIFEQAPWGGDLVPDSNFGPDVVKGDTEWLLGNIGTEDGVRLTERAVPATATSARTGKQISWEEFVEEVRELGITTPIEVGVTSEGLLRLINGHHRLLAANHLGLMDIPVKVKKISWKLDHPAPNVSEFFKKKLVGGAEPTLSRKAQKLDPEIAVERKLLAGNIPYAKPAVDTFEQFAVSASRPEVQEFIAKVRGLKMNNPRMEAAWERLMVTLQDRMASHPDDFFADPNLVDEIKAAFDDIYQIDTMASRRLLESLPATVAPEGAASPVRIMRSSQTTQNVEEYKRVAGPLDLDAFGVPIPEGTVISTFAIRDIPDLPKNPRPTPPKLFDETPHNDLTDMILWAMDPELGNKHDIANYVNDVIRPIFPSTPELEASKRELIALYEQMMYLGDFKGPQQLQEGLGVVGPAREVEYSFELLEEIQRRTEQFLFDNGLSISDTMPRPRRIRPETARHEKELLDSRPWQQQLDDTRDGSRLKASSILNRETPPPWLARGGMDPYDFGGEIAPIDTNFLYDEVADLETMLRVEDPNKVSFIQDPTDINTEVLDAGRLIGVEREEFIDDVLARGIVDPIEVGLTPDGKIILLDGYTRLSAAKELAIPDVPVVFKPLKQEAYPGEFRTRGKSIKEHLYDGDALPPPGTRVVKPTMAVDVYRNPDNGRFVMDWVGSPKSPGGIATDTKTGKVLAQIFKMASESHKVTPAEMISMLDSPQQKGAARIWKKMAEDVMADFNPNMMEHLLDKPAEYIAFEQAWGKLQETYEEIMTAYSRNFQGGKLIDLDLDPTFRAFEGEAEDIINILDEARAIAAKTNIPGATKIFPDPSKVRKTKVAVHEGFVDPALLGVGGQAVEGLVLKEEMAKFVQNLAIHNAAMWTPIGLAASKQYLNNAMSVWKGLATVARPSFHLRNIFSAAWNNQAADVRFADYVFVRDNTLKLRRYMKEEKLSFGHAVDRLPENVRPHFFAAVEQEIFDGFSTSEFRGLASAEKRKALYSLSMFNPLDTEQFGLIRAGSLFMESIEDYFRMAAFVRHFNPAQPGSARVAKEIVERMHFNYAKLTPWETKAKDYVPFFVWMRRNVPLQVEMMLENPKIIQRYNHMMSAVEGQFPPIEQDEFGQSQYMSESAAGTGIIFNKDTPFWARVMFDPDLPVRDLLDLDPTDPQKMLEWVERLVGPHITMPFQLQDQGEWGDVNAPLPMVPILKSLAKMGFYDETTDGNVRIPYALNTIYNTLLPFSRETIEPFAPVLGAANPNTAQRAGINLEEDNLLEQISKGLLRAPAGAAGFKFQTPLDTQSQDINTDQTLRQIIKELEMQGKLP